MFLIIIGIFTKPDNPYLINLTLHLIEKDKLLNAQGGQVIKLEAKLVQQDKILQEILKKLK